MNYFHKNKVAFSFQTLLFDTDHNYVKPLSDRMTSRLNNLFKSRVTQVSLEDLSTKDAIVA